MAKKERSIIRRRITNAYISSVVSISLVLLLVGIASLLLVNTRSVSDYFKENMAVSVLMKPEVNEDQAFEYQAELDSMKFVHQTEFISREQGEKEMASMLGEDFLSVFESSPIPLSFNVRLKPEYVSSDSVKVVEKIISGSPLVDEVVYKQSLVDSLNTNLKRISLVFGIFIALLLFISFVLISNTMRLSVYDKRFSINTMKLVGATKSFIRGPFLLKAAFLGLLSALLAIILLLAILYFVKEQFSQIFDIFRLESLLVVMGIVLAAGLVICVVSTWFAVGKLISLSKDELYT